MSNNKTQFSAVAVVLLPIFDVNGCRGGNNHPTRKYPRKMPKVITTSQDKLSIAPEIKMYQIKTRRRIYSIDGTLTITCDGIEGSVTVSTNTIS